MNATDFKGLQKTFTYRQLNKAAPQDVFPLLCPVRECDWLDGWNYQMIHSESGLIEKDCVFTTPMHGNEDTVWQVTQYDPESFRIEFVRFTPGDNVVKINIKLRKVHASLTESTITYRYTALSRDQNSYLEFELEQDFKNSMTWWEKAINHYLLTGEMLKRKEV